jgi:hypothetical protein
MRRTFALLLVALLIFALVGCNTTGSQKADTPNTPTTSTTPTTTKAQQQANQPPSQDNAYKPAEPIKTEPVKPEPAPTEPPAVFEEVVAIDNDYCTVKITGIELDNIWGYTLTVYLENKSSDKTFMYSVKDGAVNGVVWDPLFATKVAPGKKANEKISFMDNQKEELLGEFTDIELHLRVHDADDWRADDVAEEIVHIYPLGKDKAENYVRAQQSTDTVIVDNDQISIIVTGYRVDDLWGYTADLYLINKTDNYLMFSVKDVSVNGFMCDPLFATTVAPGKASFENMNWLSSSFEENGITTVEEIELTFRVHDSEDWSADEIFEEIIKLTP